MSSAAQLRALVQLRWRLVRSQAVRVGLLLGAGLVPLLALLPLATRHDIDIDALKAAVDAAPQAFLGFGVLAVIAPLTSSAGSELFPSDHLAGYPIRPGTQFLSSLVLAPLNLVWVVQLLVLVAETEFVTEASPHVLAPLLTLVCFVVAVTGLGQALAWTATGMRCTRKGRLVLRALLAAAVLLGVVVVRSGHANDLVGSSYGPWLVRVLRAGGDGHLGAWALGTAVLVAVAVGTLWFGLRQCRWAVRIPQDLALRSGSEERPRRAQPVDEFRALLAVDRASVWRAPALRRGALVLAILPGIAAAGVGLPWRSLVFLPGLVAAGGGLLFGFNAFCLDATGAVWLASLPHRPELVARAKARVTAEAVGLGAGLAAVLGALRAKGTPTATELTAIVASTSTATVLVVALCLSAAVRRPHRADLNGPRDAVAPPGALVLASIRLAGPAAIVGGVLQVSSSAPQWWVPLALALPVSLLSAASISRSLARYDQPFRRSLIVQTVSAG